MTVDSGDMEAGAAKMIVRPEHITSSEEGEGKFRRRDHDRHLCGQQDRIPRISTQAGSFFVTLPSTSRQFAAGDEVHLAVDPETVRLFPPE